MTPSIEATTEVIVHVCVPFHFHTRKLNSGARDIGHREESPQEFQARLERIREEQVVAEARRTAEVAARKERQAEERERGR